MPENKIWAIMPAYNEENLQSVIDKTKQYVDHIVVIDDGSEKKIEAKNAYVLRHMINLGKGAALKTGCEFAIRNGVDKFIFIDSDGQHDPDEIPYFLNALEENDIVFGYRKESGKMPFILRFGNWFLTNIVRFLFKMDLRDVQCGYRAFNIDVYKKIRWESLGYEVENEIIANVGMHKLIYTEIPIKTIYADKYKGTTILDGIRIVWKMFGWWLFKRKI